MRFELRCALARDAAAISRIAHDSLPERWSPQSFEADLGARGAVGLVAVDQDGAVVGYALGARADRELEIRSLAVARAHRRRGLARRLLGALLESQREAGAEAAVLEVRRSNAAALGLYSAAGFEPRGERRGYYADGETAIVMGVRLCGG